MSQQASRQKHTSKQSSAQRLSNNDANALILSAVCLILFLLGFFAYFVYALGSLFLAIIGVYYAVLSYLDATAHSANQYLAILSLVLLSSVFVLSLILLYSVFTVISADPYEQEVPMAFFLEIHHIAVHN